MVSPSGAQDDTPVPVVYAETDAGITLYAVSADKTLEIVGHLPEDFSADRWAIRNNLVIAPDGEKLAFAAQKGSYNEPRVALYLFSLTEQTVQQVFEEDYGGYFFHLKWSPNSRFLLIEPETEDNCGCGVWPEIRVYNLTSGEMVKLTDRSREINAGGFTWMPDSRRLSYAGNGVNIVGRDGSQRQTLVNFELEPPPKIFPAACDFAWSALRERLYYVAGCLRLVDDPLNALYSVDLSGQRRIEAFLPDMLRKEFTLPAPHEPFVEDVNVAIIHPTDSTIYAAFGFKALVLESSNPASDIDVKAFWRVIRLKAPGQIKIVFEFTAPEINFSSLLHAAFAPDNQKVALVDSEHIVVGDLTTGQQVVSLTRTLENYYLRTDVLWTDNQRLLYAADNDVWLLGTSDGTTTNLTADIESIAHLLPQTNSY